MENGYYLVCPKCGRITNNGWEAEYRETNRYRLHPNKYGDIDYELTAEGDSELIWLSHDCGFYTEAYGPDEFLIRVEDGKITDAGEFWTEDGQGLALLREIAKKHGLKVAIDDPTERQIRNALNLLVDYDTLQAGQILRITLRNDDNVFYLQGIGNGKFRLYDDREVYDYTFEAKDMDELINELTAFFEKREAELRDISLL